VPVLTSSAVRRGAARYRRLWVPLGTLVTAWEFLRANGTQRREQLCFLAGRIVEGARGPAAQVTCCVMPVTEATAGYVTLTSHAQTALILDALEERDEIPIMSLHTHGDGGADGSGPEHSDIDDHGVALGPGDGIFSAVIPHYALGSPFGFPSRATLYERVAGGWERLSPEECAARVIVHGDTLRLVRSREATDDGR
jgi:hypothetical protein